MNLARKAGIAILLSVLSGCGWSIGSSSQHQVLKSTIGQELIDLKKAHDQGALSDAEYATKKKEIIDAALAGK